jgi:hypothetical protein
VSFPRRILGLLLLAGALGAAPAVAQDSKEFRGRVLATPALAGLSVPVLTLGGFGVDSTLASGDSVLGGWSSRAAAITRFDGILGSYLTDNSPDVKWVLPDALRRMAKRAPSILPDPDRLGHQVMSAENVRRVPNPLASRLRQLVAMGDARHVFIPSGLLLKRDSLGTVQAELAAQLVDARLGDVLWRTYATGKGRSPDAAVRAAIATMVPPELNP